MEGGALATSPRGDSACAVSERRKKNWWIRGALANLRRPLRQHGLHLIDSSSHPPDGALQDREAPSMALAPFLSRTYMFF